MNMEFSADFYRGTGLHWKIAPKQIIYYIFFHQIRYLTIWRKYKRSGGFWRRFKLYRLGRKYGLEIAPTAEIGIGLYLGHPYNITIGGGVVIGKNCNLHKGCTIGRENRGAREGSPKIGDCVSIGINSTIVGNITIGNDVMIAPNSFVNFDVPSHSIVVGGKIHPRENATENYIIHKV